MKSKISRYILPLLLSGCDFNPPPQTLYTAQDFGYATMGQGEAQLPVGERPLMIIRVNGPSGTVPHTRTVQEIEDRFFNSPTSVNAYFEKVSDGMFQWSNAGIYGIWDLGQDFPEMPLTIEKALQLAVQEGVDFSRFDTNGDSIIETSELGVFVLDNYSVSGGGVRQPPCVPTQNGVTLCLRAAIMGSNPNLSGISHELTHLFGTLDLYGSGCLSLFGSLMSCGTEDLYSYLDPWHRMRLGWVEPQVVGLDGYQYQADHNTTPSFVGTERPPGYVVPPGWDGSPAPVTDTPTNTIAPGQGSCYRINPSNTVGSRPLILYSNARGNTEYFMIEARAGSFDMWAFERLSSDVYIWQVRTNEHGDIYNIQSRFNEYGMDMSLFMYGHNQIRGNSQPWTTADGDIALHWIDGRDSGIQVRVSDQKMDAVQNTPYHWVEVGTAGQYPAPGAISEVLVTVDALTVRGDLGLGSSTWYLESNGVRVPLEIEAKGCNEWTFARPADFTDEMLAHAALIRDDIQVYPALNNEAD